MVQNMAAHHLSWQERARRHWTKGHRYNWSYRRSLGEQRRFDLKPRRRWHRNVFHPKDVPGKTQIARAGQSWRFLCNSYCLAQAQAVEEEV